MCFKLIRYNKCKITVSKQDRNEAVEDGNLDSEY